MAPPKKTTHEGTRRLSISNFEGVGSPGGKGSRGATTSEAQTTEAGPQQTVPTNGSPPPWEVETKRNETPGGPRWLMEIQRLVVDST